MRQDTNTVTGREQQSGSTEVHVVVSDLHMSEGVTTDVSLRPSWWQRGWHSVKAFLFGVEAPSRVHPANPMEDFPDDTPFVAFLERVLAEYGKTPRLVLRLLGDNFDSLAVTWEGRYADPPFESVGVAKLERIIVGHPAFFKALTDFLRQPNCHVDFFVGNHDLFLVWPAVQERLRLELAATDPDMARRIRFIDQHRKFEDCHRGVLYCHGMNAEAQNAIDPDHAVIEERFGLPLKRPVLNTPYGSYMTLGVVKRLKQYHPLIGRLANYRGLARNAAVHRWGWSFYAFSVIVWHLASSFFFAIADIRKKTRLRDIWRYIFDAIRNDTVDRYALRLLQRRSDVKVVIMGHSHEWRRLSGPHGTYFNTGSWQIMFDYVRPKLQRGWRRFRWFEPAWLAWRHYRATGRIHDSQIVGKRLLWLIAVLALLTYLVTCVVGGATVWPVVAGNFRWSAVILLVGLLTVGLLRLFDLRPIVVSVQRFTFVLVRHGEDDLLDVDLLEFEPETGRFRQCL